jgi:GDP-L-fucose synthase
MSFGAIKIGLLGGGGLLGSAIARQAIAQGIALSKTRSKEVDARDERAVSAWLSHTKPDVLIVCAARNAGVHVNLSSPADMLLENARIAIASIGAARQARISRLLYCSSGAIYPIDAPIPYSERYANEGKLESSHAGYSAAKQLGLRLCQAVRLQDQLDYTALLLTNIYGPGQNYDPARSNVVGALLARIHAAKIAGDREVVVWGTGEATRDLIYVEDAASAILGLSKQEGPEDSVINVATGHEMAIRDIAATIREVVGYTGQLVFDHSKPEGALRRVMDVSRLAARGLTPASSLAVGLRQTYAAYLANVSTARERT